MAKKHASNTASKIMSRDNKNSIEACGRIKCIQSKGHKDRQKKYF